jgi:membrane protein implicated in regulation of membrane protease activity
MVRDRLTTTRYRTTKSLATGALFLLLSGVLFLFHWRWVRRLDEKAAA